MDRFVACFGCTRYGFSKCPKHGKVKVVKKDVQQVPSKQTATRQEHPEEAINRLRSEWGIVNDKRAQPNVRAELEKLFPTSN